MSDIVLELGLSVSSVSSVSSVTEMDNLLRFGAGSNLTPRALRLQVQLLFGNP